MTVLTIAGTYMLAKDKPYEGQALFFIGSVNSPQLGNQNTILALFSEEIQNNIDDLFVSEKGQVKVKVSGNSQQEVQGYVDEIVGVYFKELEEAAKIRIDLTNESIEKYKEREKDLVNIIGLYNKKLESENVEMTETYTDLLLISEQELSNTTLRIKNMETDVKLFENPLVLSTSVTKDKTYTKEAIAIGIILGLLLTVVLLMLMKYIGDARRYFKE